MMKWLIVLGLSLVLVSTSAAPVLAGKKAGPAKNDWRGWWYVYHYNDKGKLVPEKFIRAWVIDDPIAQGSGRGTGLWVGCIWAGTAQIDYGKDGSISLVFTPTGEDTVTFKMTKSEPDKADGVESGEPEVKYIVYRRPNPKKDCPGYYR